MENFPCSGRDRPRTRKKNATLPRKTKEVKNCKITIGWEASGLTKTFMMEKMQTKIRFLELTREMKVE